MSVAPDVLVDRLERLTPEQRSRLAARLGMATAAGDTAGGTRLVAYVEPGAAASPAAAELRAFLQERLPEHMVPARFVVLDRLPRTPNGKVDVHALPAPEPAGALTECYVAPRTRVEQTLAAIWSELLGGTQVGVHDNFFEIGGDSILSIQVVSRAARAGLHLTADQLFQHQTIAGLAPTCGAAPATRTPEDPPAGDVPLTPIQHWFFEQPLPEPHHWHQVQLLEARAAIDTARLEEAISAVVSAHDALRLRFVRAGTGWRQRYDGSSPAVRVDTLDLSAVPATAHEDGLRAAAAALAGATDLARGPLIGAAVVRRGAGRPDAVLIAIHHLVVDAVSWQVLAEDLAAAYQRPDGGAQAPRPGAAAPFGAWAHALAEHARSGAVRAETDHWLAVAAAAAPLPVDLPGTFTEARARTVVAALSPADTALLVGRLPATCRVRVDEVLLAALARACSTWTGDAALLVGVERHGREAITGDMDLARTVGWFTSYFPAALQVRADAAPGAALASIREQLRRVPSRGIGYGVLRYLAPDSTIGQRLRAAPQPQIVFNYAGRNAPPAPQHSSLRVAGAVQSSRAASNGRSHCIELNAFHAGDALRCAWTYSTTVHQPDTIERLAAAYMDALRELIRHGASAGVADYTPADFPEADLAQDELDRLLGKLFP